MPTKNSLEREAVARPFPADPSSCHDDVGTTTSPRWPLAPLALAVLATASACAPVDESFVVDTTDDAHDSVPGDGVCATLEGQCSLRAAIEETNATPVDVGVRVDVGAGHYELTLDTGVPHEGLVLSRGNVTVQGAGREQSVVDGLGERRLLRIDGVHNRLITIESLSLVNGWVPEARNGGAVFIVSYELPGVTPYLVSFVDTEIADSHAGFRGGGIYAAGKGTLNVVDSQVHDNGATQGCATSIVGGGQSGGGGIFIGGGTLHLVHTEVRGNCGSNGGGIRVIGPHAGEHLILGSTLSGNLSMTSGGGLNLYGSGMLIEDSTFTGNEVTTSDAWERRSVGGIHVENSALTIESSTIVGNENPYARYGYGNAPSSGAGGVLSHLGSVVMRNSVLAEHADSSLRECFGPIVSAGGNFLGESDEGCQFGSVPTDIVDGGDPKLGPLGFNGGSTRTLHPSSDSPLLDAGIPGCEPIDQRAAGFEAPSGGACDIGAVERQVDDSGREQGTPGSLAELLDGDAPWAEAYPELRRAAERLGEEAGVDPDARPGDLLVPLRRSGSEPVQEKLSSESGR